MVPQRDGTFDQRISPVQVTGLAKDAQATAGHGFSRTLRKPVNTGTGSNSYGQLGDNLEATRSTSKLEVRYFEHRPVFFIAFS